MKIFKNQIWHLFFLVIFLWIVAFLSDNFPSLLDGELWGVSTKIWLFSAFVSPIIHQIYALVCWRLELHYQLLSKTFGARGFLFYKIGFAILIISRPITITLLAISNTNTCPINPLVTYLISTLLIIPVIYLFYSIKKYFGVDRAFGIDHFEPEKARILPLVNKGIFKYSSNAMYVFGFLILWIPGIIFKSNAALLVSLFSHIYIWIHFFVPKNLT